MKRTIVVLALAVLSSAGCRAIETNRGQGCAEPCGAECGDSCSDSCGDACGCGDEGCESCHMKTARFAPRPMGPGRCNTGGRGGNLEQACPGGQDCCFDRYCGSECGPGYHPGPYDCSPCNSPHWGCSGYRHPHGYRENRGCLCNCQGQIPGHCKTPGPHCPCCGHGYCCTCCGPPAPGCSVCCGGASGDQNYNFQPGPPVAQTAYPYYTLRGPRDFLLDNPPSIGPY
jgi:hypothetical protein